MQVEAIYEDGKVRFVMPIRLKKHVIRMRIDIPDEEIEQGPEENQATQKPGTPQQPSSFAAELRAILAPVSAELASARSQPLSKSEIREARADAWEKKHSG